ncbi:acyl-CoA dehydrogenase family protein [Sphingomonas colocasiae]|uniref:Acyl-CoA/acyl-ACP dehydrogenase n=1 Tax=Sphingomonas colocasiae TaxID=1848973 RepID=A0ABS7PHK0_9SPHN|nr:acyl-CoA dehydrogenase family protein [Sphingomonas colocasiae]MBY8820766.1 acyl-CoA/acyl-ACP dehydrogenase [Sphingomonas colocasiae]
MADSRMPTDEALVALTGQLAALAADYDRSAVFPARCIDHIRDAGLVALTVCTDLGGGGAGIAAAAHVLGAVARGDPSSALILAMTYGFGLKTRMLKGDARAAADIVLRDVVARSALVGEFRVEPDLGTPARGGLPATIARRAAGGWRIFGRKTYATGSIGLDWCSVLARTDEDAPRIGRFLVRVEAPGVAVEESWDHLGMRATVSHDMVFDDVLVGEADVIGLDLPGTAALTTDDVAGALWNALSIPVIYHGVAQSARDWLGGYLNDRAPSNLGASLATLPRVQERFGEIETLLLANDLILRSAMAIAEQATRGSIETAEAAKHLVTANATKAVGIALELTGNPGLSRRNPLERHYRDVMCSRIHSPQSDTILRNAGRRALERRVAAR